jgi:RNA polymerase sigma factor (sigma-70 family)
LLAIELYKPLASPGGAPGKKFRNIRVAVASHAHVEESPAPFSPETSSEIELMQSGYRYALSLTHHRHDAEDLLQEAWLNLCRRYGAASSQAALYTTIRHLFIDRCRRNRVIAFDAVEEMPQPLPAPPETPPGTVGDVESLLGRLRPGEREAVYLHYIAGHTAEEVGALTHQPRGTVLSLLHRTLKKLQSMVSSTG